MAHAVVDRRSEQGYSLIEMLVALMVTAILASMAVVQINAGRPALIADGAMHTMMAQINAAREVAVAQRRNIELTFVGSDQMSVSRRELPAGTTLLKSVVLEGRMVFHLFVPATDTPDGFGAGSSLDFQGAATIMFNSDGMLVDGTGTPINGSLFLAIPSERHTARAVTILGSTGRVRGYRWTGTGWSRV